MRSIVIAVSALGLVASLSGCGGAIEHDGLAGSSSGRGDAAGPGVGAPADGDHASSSPSDCRPGVVVLTGTVVWKGTGNVPDEATVARGDPWGQAIAMGPETKVDASGAFALDVPDADVPASGVIDVVAKAITSGPGINDDGTMATWVFSATKDVRVTGCRQDLGRIEIE